MRREISNQVLVPMEEFFCGNGVGLGDGIAKEEPIVVPDGDAIGAERGEDNGLGDVTVLWIGFVIIIVGSMTIVYHPMVIDVDVVGSGDGGGQAAGG